MKTFSRMTALFSIAALTVVILPERIPQETLITVDLQPIAQFAQQPMDIPVPERRPTQEQQPSTRAPGSASPKTVAVIAPQEIAPASAGNFRMRDRDVARAIELQKRMQSDF